MKNHFFLIIVFLLAIPAATRAMDPDELVQHRTNQCGVCFRPEIPALLTSLSCGCQFHRDCIQKYVQIPLDRNMNPRCPICLEFLTQADAIALSDMYQFLKKHPELSLLPGIVLVVILSVLGHYLLDFQTNLNSTP